MALRSCGDPESFAIGVQTVKTFFVSIQIPLEVSDLPPVSETEFKWRADDGPTLDASLVAL